MNEFFIIGTFGVVGSFLITHDSAFSIIYYLPLPNPNEVQILKYSIQDGNNKHHYS